MRITFKLFASLAEYLPPSAVRNAIEVDVADGSSLNAILDSFHVPREMAHLVLVNGVYADFEERDTLTVQDGDVLAVWPPVAGG